MSGAVFALPLLYSLTLLLSAFLLFTVEFMIARLILPLFGGAPAVWNTCMMFFQAALLAGYAWAHLVSERAACGRQIFLQSAVLAAGCLALPVGIPAFWPWLGGLPPVAGVLLLLGASVGVPFFALSATAPLLQGWFARTGHSAASDPYFLYSASNLGSMAALAAYPFAAEPFLSLAEQGRLWSLAYVAVLVLTILCGLAARRGGKAAGGDQAPAEAETSAPSLGEQGLWVLLAFVPASLLLGVTGFLSTDVAAVPLFWVVPLGLYLLSFIIVFSRGPGVVYRLSRHLFPLTICLLGVITFANLRPPKAAVFAVHLINFFLVCMVCHGRLASLRPGVRHLTRYYLALSLGGVLGGTFNSLAAPLLFNTVLEYPLVLAAAAFLLPQGGGRKAADRIPPREAALYGGAAAGLLALAYVTAVYWPVRHLDLYRLSRLLDLPWDQLEQAVAYGGIFLLAYGLVHLRRPLLFGVGIAVLFGTFTATKDFTPDILYRHRSFFGVLTVSESADGTFMKLTHGTTLHGKQWLNHLTKGEPVSYYHREGPVGRVFAAFSGPLRKKRIAVAGLGTGSLAAYAGKGQVLDFYEIDPAVVEIATNRAYFSFLGDCQANWRVIVGDARLKLAGAKEPYDLIILDAFSSDAIPVHLLTKEALALYLTKLSSGGAILLHITNRYLDLEPVVAAAAAELQLTARLCDDGPDYSLGKDGSTWVVLARREDDLGALAWDREWRPVQKAAGVPAWRDDFSNIFRVFKW